MSQHERGARSTGRRARRLQPSSGLLLLVVLGLAAACTYQPLSDAEKAGFGAAGAGAEAGESDLTSTSDSSSNESNSSSTSGGTGGDTGTQSSTETTTGSVSTSNGGTSGSTTSGSGGSPGTGGSSGSGGSPGTGGTGGVGGSSGGGGSAGTGGASGGSSGTGGVTGSGGTSSTLTFRYVRLVATSSQNGKPFAAVAELELLDENGQALDNSGWTASADSEELVDEVAPASQAIDSDTDTFWHTEWGSYEAPLPHYLQIDLGQAEQISGFVYTPRQDGLQNGWILDWELYLSNSATMPGTAVASGSFATGSSPKTVNLP